LREVRREHADHLPRGAEQRRRLASQGTRTLHDIPSLRAGEDRMSAHVRDDSAPRELQRPVAGSRSPVVYGSEELHKWLFKPQLSDHTKTFGETSCTFARAAAVLLTAARSAHSTSRPPSDAANFAAAKSSADNLRRRAGGGLFCESSKACISCARSSVDAALASALSVFSRARRAASL